MTSSSNEKSSWWICNLSKTHLLSVKWASIGWTRRAGVWDAEMQSLGPPRDLQVGKKLEPVEPQSLGRLLLFSFIVAHTAIATCCCTSKQKAALVALSKPVASILCVQLACCCSFAVTVTQIHIFAQLPIKRQLFSPVILIGHQARSCNLQLAIKC